MSHTNEREMRVLIVSEHASAKFGGEAILPLHYFQRLRARNLDVWLVSHARVEAELKGLFPGCEDRLRFVPDDWVHRLLFRLGKLVPNRVAENTFGLISHLYTQLKAKRIVRALVKQHGIDIVHQPIPVSPKMPSFIYGLGVPVVIGPMNGGMEFPPAFRQRESILTRWFVAMGRSLSHLVHLVVPGKRVAQIILVANHRTQLALPSGLKGDVRELVENGVDLTLWHRKDRLACPDGRLRLIFLGRLVAFKAVDILLEALALVIGEVNVRLSIVGDGPARPYLEEQARRFGLDRQVEFLGWQPQEKCALLIQEQDVLVMPSLYECGGAVVLEAMATGLPVISTRWGGPADYLDESCGILIDPSSKQELIRGFAAAVVKLAKSPELCIHLGANGRRRAVEVFDWQRKIDEMLDIYQEAIRIWKGLEVRSTAARQYAEKL